MAHLLHASYHIFIYTLSLLSLLATNSIVSLKKGDFLYPIDPPPFHWGHWGQAEQYMPKNELIKKCG